MASSNHQAIKAEPLNHICTSRQSPFVLVVSVPLQKRNCACLKTVKRKSEGVGKKAV